MKKKTESFYCFDWTEHSLSNPKIVKVLIRLNSKYNPSYNIDYKVNHAIINAYLDFNEILSGCNFSPLQTRLLSCLMDGMTIGDYCWLYKKEHKRTLEMYRTIVKKINKTNEEHYADWIEQLEIQGRFKIPNAVKYKRCPKCERDLRINGNNFGEDERSKDGFQTICKKCDSHRKKPPEKAVQTGVIYVEGVKKNIEK